MVTSTTTAIGLFTRDPIEYEDGMLLYRCSMDINAIDPYGLYEVPSDPAKGLSKCTVNSITTRIKLDDFFKVIKTGAWTIRGSVGIDLHTLTRHCTKKCDCDRTAPYEDISATGVINGRITATLGIDEDFTDGSWGFKVWGGIRFELHAQGSISANYYEDGCTGIKDGRICFSIEGRGTVRGGVEAKVKYKKSEWDLAAVEVVGSCYGKHQRCYQYNGGSIGYDAGSSGFKCDAYFRICQWGFCYRRQLY